MDAPQLRYLSTDAIDLCLPDVDGRLDLAAAALFALATGAAEMPPKIGVHPRPGALLHAMPAWLREGDVVGLKWIAAYPGNRSRGLPAINGLVVLNDPETGLPTWIMDAARITALRTAAVTGVAIRLFRPLNVERVAILGAGVQARSHAEVVAALLPEAELVVHDRHAERAEALAAQARERGGRATVAPTARDAAASAQVVISVATLGSSNQAMTPEWLTAGALAIAVDFATYASASLARAVRIFVVDDRDQFLAYREAGYFEGYPEPSATMGELLQPRRAPVQLDGDGGLPALVTHLGVGLADVIFADAIRRRAEALGEGIKLDR